MVIMFSHLVGSTVRPRGPHGTELPDARSVPAPSDGPHREPSQPSRIVRGITDEDHSVAPPASGALRGPIADSPPHSRSTPVIGAFASCRRAAYGCRACSFCHFRGVGLFSPCGGLLPGQSRGPNGFGPMRVNQPNIDTSGFKGMEGQYAFGEPAWRELPLIRACEGGGQRRTGEPSCFRPSGEIESASTDAATIGACYRSERVWCSRGGPRPWRRRPLWLQTRNSRSPDIPEKSGSRSNRKEGMAL